ncbi:beta-ketoacyl-[acyl-carrier-protein] synthase family protein [Aureliella helgolandensis]|uniref:Actinorhodin polyketide putative beta-ketoacyl synthase 1 n=1 Tax=Aureliella helgolandensis TaxID=2527968 RepID=A0A518GEK4_9BACT|nr:beta-ketoacyl-[acyl-carrier-protein] synthase family protein [Aureliella helgolandensis]QDV26987.1 Actinorhodin polyketide putative beta-ketoacyl synthase 1 [Aureliella helgolandensis]
MVQVASNILKFPHPQLVDEDPIVITGIGMAASLGADRETLWQNIQRGRSGIRMTEAADDVGPLRLPCGMVDWLGGDPQRLKSIRLSEHVAGEAIADACIPMEEIDRERFACSISAQFGDVGYSYLPPETRDTCPTNASGHPWWDEFLPCAATTLVARKYDLRGPRLCHTTACASGLVSTIAAARMLKSDQCDFALCGAADAVTKLVFAAFHRMGVLSTGPTPEQACRPFDVDRSGFVMGEGAAMMVLERRSSAVARGARIYAEIAATQTLCQAHHVTGLDGDGDTLKELISRLVDRAGWGFQGPQYINAHGTGTTQNDRSELLAIRAALGPMADQVIASSNKAVLGHLINAAGSIELALTAMSLRDGFAPPTMNLDNPEKIGRVNCLPMYGEQRELDRALKLSLAFGGHLVGIALRRCPLEEAQRTAEPLVADARIRTTERVAQRVAA